MEANVYKAMTMSASSYAMASRYPECKKTWEDIGTLWALSSPQKNPDSWEKTQQEAILATEKNQIDEVAILFGVHVIATKILSKNFSRTYADSQTDFEAKFEQDPDKTRNVTKILEQRAEKYITSHL